MTTATRKRKPAEESGAVFDRELDDLPQELRWREWMGRVQAVLFASASPVGRADLARVVGQGASVDMLIEDIQAELTGRPYELAQVAGGWMFWTKTQFAGAIKAAANLGEQSLAFTEMEMGVLCAIAYHQPIDRAGLADIFGEEVSRELLARALQGPDRLWTAVAASGSAAYLRDDGYVSGDIRSSEPAGLAEAGNSLRTVRVVRLVWRCTRQHAKLQEVAAWRVAN